MSGIAMASSIGVLQAGGLAATASILGEILGVDFKKELLGTYDEFPAYIGDMDGARYALLGNPAPEDDLREEPSDILQLLIKLRYPSFGLTADELAVSLSEKITIDGRLTCCSLD